MTQDKDILDNAPNNNDLEQAGTDINSSKKTGIKGSRAFLTIVLVVGLSIVAGVLYSSFSRVEKSTEADTLDTDRSGIYNSLKTPDKPRPAPPPKVEEKEVTPKRERQTFLPPPAPQPVQPVIMPTPAPKVDKVKERRLNSGLNANNSNESANQATGSQDQQTADRGPLSDKLRPLELAPSVAGQLGDRNFLLTQGTMIDCTLQTKLISTQAGMLTCLATHDVMSANGKVKLIDAGTKFTGYQSGGIEQGQARAFITWNRLETPTGVILNLGSPGTGALGEAGVDGYVDNHFWDRFGNAILLSLVGDFGNWAANQANRNDGNNIRFDNTREGSQDAVSKILEKSLDIPPTLYKNQGERVGIMVARDLDFSGVYELESIK